MAIDLSDLAAKLTIVRVELAALGSLATVTLLTAAPLKAALTEAVNAAAAAQDLSEAALAVSTSAGIGSGAPITSAADFRAYSDIAAQAPDLNDTLNYLARMLGNLEAGV